jgi:CBS-domain-containing membrane protein
MLNKFIGLSTGNVSHAERLISTIGGVLAIFATFSISNFYLGDSAIPLIVPSMGASAVLLFAAPHSALAQPWNVLGGHVISALVGVSCYLLVPHEIGAASLAVGIAIGAMYYLHCIHPPGGATALAAVIGGESVHSLGYGFVLTPVLLNVVVMLIIAVAFNFMFSWRRYPSLLHTPPVAALQTSGTEVGGTTINHSDLVAALGQIDSFIDVSEDDLLHIYDIATGQARHGHLQADDIVPGHYYSNGVEGPDWQVRRVVDESGDTDPANNTIVYKVIVGENRGTSGVLTRRQFSRWARFEVVQKGEHWEQLDKT